MGYETRNRPEEGGSTLCLLPNAYRRFDHPRALAQGNGYPWPALTGCPIGRHCYLEILNASQMLDDLPAIMAPHVDSIQKVESGAHMVDGGPLLYRNWRNPPRQRG
jgi:hypothetical protein